MRARIKPETLVNTPNKTLVEIPKKIVQDEQYARDFYDTIKEHNVNANLGNSFEDWYEKIKLADFYWKIVDAENSVKRGK